MQGSLFAALERDHGARPVRCAHAVVAATPPFHHERLARGAVVIIRVRSVAAQRAPIVMDMRVVRGDEPGSSHRRTS